MYYCTFHNAFGHIGKFITFIPLGCFFLFIAMYLLASTADNYLSPALETITTKFGLSDSLAGVTFLAFGNGAPDVFSAIAAATGGDPDDGRDATKSLSVILGGTFVITCIVTVLCSRVANLNDDDTGKPIRKIRVTPKFFVRDVIFCILATVYCLIIMLFVNYFNIYSSIGLLVLYGVYVIMVVAQTKKVDPEDR